MSDFWSSDLGEVTGKPEDAFAKTFTHIPDGTMALAKIEHFINAEYNGNKYLSIDWVLTDGDFRGQKVNQKLKVWGTLGEKDPAKTRHRALNMLKLIYQLYNVKPTHSGEPTDKDLSIFLGKTAGIMIRETEPNHEGKQYNWVGEIHEAKGFKCETGVSIVVAHKNSYSDPLDSAFRRNESHVKNNDMIDDIPF
jgi:hypothetical protein